MGTMNCTARWSSAGMGPITALPDRQRLQRALERRRLAQLGWREGGVAFNHDDGGNLARVPELFLPIPGLGGLRAGRQEGRLIVGRDFLQPAEGGPANAGNGSQVRTRSTGISQRSQNGTRGAVWTGFFMAYLQGGRARLVQAGLRMNPS